MRNVDPSWSAIGHLHASATAASSFLQMFQDSSVFQAVCCEDHIHCCPADTVCNLQTQTCDSPSRGHPPLHWVEKMPALTSGGHGEQCDKQTSCPGSTTCCKKLSGQWACCPLHQVSAGGAFLFLTEFL